MVAAVRPLHDAGVAFSLIILAVAFIREFPLGASTELGIIWLVRPSLGSAPQGRSNRLAGQSLMKTPYLHRVEADRRAKPGAFE